MFKETSVLDLHKCQGALLHSCCLQAPDLSFKINGFQLTALHKSNKSQGLSGMGLFKKKSHVLNPTES